MTGTRPRSILASRLVASAGAGEQPRITEDLRRAILDGDEPPGTLIPIDAVARFFGVRRIPVREVLEVLLGEGLVAHVPHIIRGLIAVAWYGVQTFLAAGSLTIVVLTLFPGLTDHATEHPRVRAGGPRPRGRPVRREQVTRSCEQALERDGSDGLVLGCAGTADLADHVSATLGVPVVDGVGAAVLPVESLLRLDLATSKHGEPATPPVEQLA